jgi:PLP dependent protein
MTVDGARTHGIAQGLARVQARITQACAGAGRDPQQVTLIVVTKTYPASDVQALVDLGVRDVGENRDQEAGAKAAQVAVPGLRWHFIGQLQTNKAKSVVRYAHAVHSVDRPSLVSALGRAAAAAAEAPVAGESPVAGERPVGDPVPLDCLIQVSLDGDVSRGGAPIDQVWTLADLISDHAWLRPAGVMAVAPLGSDPDRAFARLHEVSQRLREAHPGATAISAGMSGDLEPAIRHGATHLRVGGAVLGDRPPLGYGRNAEAE